MTPAILPPVTHECCGTPCTFEQLDFGACWGPTNCVDTETIEDEDGEIDEWRIATCAAHEDCYPSYDRARYKAPPNDRGSPHPSTEKETNR